MRKIAPLKHVTAFAPRYFGNITIHLKCGKPIFGAFLVYECHHLRFGRWIHSKRYSLLRHIDGQPLMASRRNGQKPPGLARKLFKRRLHFSAILFG